MNEGNVDDVVEYLRDRYPLSRYEVRWNNGHVEFIEATNVVIPYKSSVGFEETEMIRFLRDDGGKGPVTLLLAVDSRVIFSIRNLTEMENEVQE